MTAVFGTKRVDAHLRVEVEASSAPGWAELADVLVSSAPLRAKAAERRLARLFARYPGCLVAVTVLTGGGFLAGVRDGARLRAVPEGPWPHAGREAGAALASLLHGWLVLGRRPERLDGALLRSAEGALRLLAWRKGTGRAAPASPEAAGPEPPARGACPGSAPARGE